MSEFMQWITHGVKRGKDKVSSRLVISLSVFFVVLILIGAIYLMLVSRIAARGRHIEQLQADLFRLQRETEHLEVEIAEASAVVDLWERAAGLGFMPAAEVEFLQPRGSNTP